MVRELKVKSAVFVKQRGRTFEVYLVRVRIWGKKSVSVLNVPSGRSRLPVKIWTMELERNCPLQSQITAAAALPVHLNMVLIIRVTKYTFLAKVWSLCNQIHRKTFSSPFINNRTKLFYSEKEGILTTKEPMEVQVQKCSSQVNNRNYNKYQI